MMEFERITSICKETKIEIYIVDIAFDNLKIEEMIRINIFALP